MATRKDLLKAQSFISRRMVAAFVDRDPDDPTPPLRRVGTATFVSVLLGVVLLAGTALIGMLRPGGGDAWKEEGIIISDTSAGMLFVYSGESLVPMADVASARLQAGGKDADGVPRVVKVSTEKLRGTNQLPMLGIPGAPRQLPGREDMDAAPLRLCSSKPTSSGDRFVSLEFDAETPSGPPISVVVRTANEKQYLISNGKAHELWKKQGQDSPLVEDLPILTPGTLWMSAMPTGEPINPMKFPDRGAIPSRNPLGMRVGDLAEVEGAEGGNNRYYVHLDRGLSQVSYLDMRLIQADNDGARTRKISESELASARNDEIRFAGNRDVDPGKPAAPVGYGSLDSASLCASFSGDDASRMQLTVDVATPAIPPQHRHPNGAAVDHVEMAPLSGALLQNANNPADDAATFLVVAGLSYPIPDVASRRALGYGDVAPTRVPGQLITLLQAGLAPDMNLSLQKITVIA